MKVYYMKNITLFLVITLLASPLLAMESGQSPESLDFRGIPKRWTSLAEAGKIPEGWEKLAAETFYTAFQSFACDIEDTKPIVIADNLNGIEVSNSIFEKSGQTLFFRYVFDKNPPPQALIASCCFSLTNVSFLDAIPVKNLRFLDIQYSCLRDVQKLEPIKKLTHLTYLMLSHISTHEEQRLTFSQALPMCKILWDSDYYLNGQPVICSTVDEVRQFFLPHYEKASRVAHKADYFRACDGQKTINLSHMIECDNLALQLIIQKHPKVTRFGAWHLSNTIDISCLFPENGIKIRSLEISEVKLKSLDQLKKLTHLEHLMLIDYIAFKEDRIAFSQALPNCKIFFEQNYSYLNGVRHPDKH